VTADRFRRSRDFKAGHRAAGGRPVEVERTAREASLNDLLDRVLDKGIVVDPWARLSRMGIDLIAGKMRIVVGTSETYRK
jgi:Gas vesicle protein